MPVLTKFRHFILNTANHFHGVMLINLYMVYRSKLFIVANFYRHNLLYLHLKQTSLFITYFPTTTLPPIRILLNQVQLLNPCILQKHGKSS